MEKPIHAKPSYYAIMFEPLKAIALKYGYNLVLHGSINRDMDLIAIPWEDQVGNADLMIDEFCEYVGGKISLFNRRHNKEGNVEGDRYSQKPHGRICYIIDIYRGGYMSESGFTKMTFFEDPQTYIDISVIPALQNYGQEAKQ